jgi:thymidylate synthase
MSADSFLGVPYNIAGYAFLLEVLGLMTGRVPRKLKIDFGDFHFYEVHETEDNALTKLNEHAALNIDYALPKLQMPTGMWASGDAYDFSAKSMEDWAHPTNFSLSEFSNGPFIKARMIE